MEIVLRYFITIMKYNLSYLMGKYNMKYDHVCRIGLASSCFVIKYIITIIIEIGLRYFMIIMKYIILNIIGELINLC